MSKSLSIAIASIGLVSATVALSVVASATQQNEAEFDELSQREIEDRFSERKQVQELRSFLWLEAEVEQSQLRSLKDASVLFVGYMRQESLTQEFLDDFNNYPIVPKLILRSDVQTINPIHVASINSAADPSITCAALIQVVGKGGNEPMTLQAKEMVDRFASLLPERPLDENCDFIDPPVPEGFEERVTLPSLFVSLLREKPKLCSEFSQTHSDHIDLTPDMRFDVRLISVGDQMPRARFHLPNLYFDYPIRRGFFGTLNEGSFEEIQLLGFGNYAAREKDALLEYRVIEDESADQHCYVLDIIQGDARRRFTMTEARDGSVLPWNSGRSDRGKSHAVRPAQLQRFGSKAAAALLVENGYETSHQD